MNPPAILSPEYIKNELSAKVGFDAWRNFLWDQRVVRIKHQ